MKYLRLYESFNEIDAICKKYGIEDYTINPDESVDVDGNVTLYGKGLTVQLPFRKVTGYFNCSRNRLTSLEGGPESVGGDFYCYSNQLTSLEGGPESVGGEFDCSDNKLISLEGAPESVGGNFVCSDNKLTSLEGGPKSVGGDFDCSSNQLTSLEGYPEKVGGNFACHGNQLTSLEHFPKVVGGNIYIDNNPVNAIWQLFKDMDKIELFNDYDCIRGNDIIIDRLNEFLQSIGKPPVKSVEGYNNI